MNNENIEKATSVFETIANEEFNKLKTAMWEMASGWYDKFNDPIPAHLILKTPHSDIVTELSGNTTEERRENIQKIAIQMAKDGQMITSAWLVSEAFANKVNTPKTWNTWTEEKQNKWLEKKTQATKGKGDEILIVAGSSITKKSYMKMGNIIKTKDKQKVKAMKEYKDVDIQDNLLSCFYPAYVPSYVYHNAEKTMNNARRAGLI